MKQISVEEAQAMLAGVERPQLVDCREPWEYQRGSLPGAVLLPLGEIVERAGELDPARPVLVYCHAGVRSVSAAILLEQAGFTTMSMRGGTDAWSQRIDPSLPRY